MIKKWTTFILIFFLIALGKSLLAQESYWVFFTDKKDVQFNPYEYFDTKAIERRITNNVALNDPSDWPLNSNYVQAVTKLADSVSGHTRWFNALSVKATSEQIAQIKTLPFVKKIESMEYYAIPASIKGCDHSAENYNLRRKQLDILGKEDFEKGGFRGKGVRIAIFDGGFPGVNTSPAFKQIRDEHRLIDTWDFTKNKAFVFYSIAHGTEVMSNIGGQVIENDDTASYGLATDAEFLLAKTEVKREPYSEEKNWLMAVEWADKMGADIINSSLGYTNDRYFRSDMNGQKSLVSRAGNMAARKGILVVNAAGNDGDNKWFIIGAPADADSVLAVGGIEPSDDYHISFSSYGPTADGRMKPNVCAYGTTIVANEDGLEVEVDGTSFASPLIAGFAACALQANPGIKNMELFHLIEESAHLYPYFDYAHGFGIPQADFVISKKKKAVQKNFDAKLKGNNVKIKILDFNQHKIGSSELIYLNIMNKDGKLSFYKVVSVNQRSFVIKTYSEYFDKNVDKITIYYRGYIQEIAL